MEKGYAFWSASVDFIPFLGLSGGFAARNFFFGERLSASMAGSLHLRFSLCTTSDSRPGPGGSRTAASCQPQA